MRAQKIAVACLMFVAAVVSQSTPETVTPILSQRLIAPEVVSFELRHYLMPHVPSLVVPSSPAEAKAQSDRIRNHLLNDVIFHGWPREWVDAPPRFVETGVLPGNGYRIRKLRYEIVPGFYSAALLYEPENLKGKVPAILNVNGHVGAEGKAVEYKQKRCINYAKRGILALSLEWFGFGELAGPENDHGYVGHLDLVGANGVGLFYLEMRKGLDYLYEHPNVDRTRLAVTGLSGGGWQTIVLSSLDPRVIASVPVAGYCSLTTAIEHPEYAGDDAEQNASDFRDGQDYVQLTAMRAPRPTLLIFNAEDDCCFRSGIVKPYIYDQIKPFFRLYGKPDVFQYYENADPGTHNYQLDNRQHSYEFFDRQFVINAPTQEYPCATEVRSYDELVVGLPKDNLTLVKLARRMAHEIDRARASQPPASRDRLIQVVRYKPVQVEHAWALDKTKNKGVESMAYRFDFTNGLSATGVLVKAIATPENAPVTIVLNDGGMKASAAEAADRVNRGQRVLAVDLLFQGKVVSGDPGVPEFTQMLAGVGERALGIEAAQLNAIATWIRPTTSGGIRIVASGPRNHTVSLTAAALQPQLFAGLEIHDSMQSLRHILDVPLSYDQVPDLLCLDLYKDFDLMSLVSLASPTKVTQLPEPAEPAK